jgi:hypothetical protein
MLRIKSEQHFHLSLFCTGCDNCVISASACNTGCGSTSKKTGVRRCRQGCRMDSLHEVRFKEAQSIGWRYAMWCGKTGEDRVAFDESWSGHYHTFPFSQTTLDLSIGSDVVFMPGTDCGDYATRIEEEGWHGQESPRSRRTLRRVSSTARDVSAGTVPWGMATRRRPRRSSFTLRGVGSISIRPPLNRTSRDIPVFRPACCRISFGMTNRPPESMVVFIP